MKHTDGRKFIGDDSYAGLGDIWILADLTNPSLGRFDGTVIAVDVQLDAVVNDLPRYVVINVVEQLLDFFGAELPHFPTLDANRVVMAMTDIGETIEGSSIHQGKLADHSLFKKEFDGPIYGCFTHRRQFFNERLDSEVLLLLLQQLGNSFPGAGGPIASVFEYRHQVCSWLLDSQLANRF